jgi:hypothetical protein
MGGSRGKALSGSKAICGGKAGWPDFALDLQEIARTGCEDILPGRAGAIAHGGEGEDDGGEEDVCSEHVLPVFLFLSPVRESSAGPVRM